MQLLNVKDIIVPEDRQRKIFDPLYIASLKSSIEIPPGLLHPIVTRRSTLGVVLVAGECRLKAIKEIFELGGSYEYEGVEVPADHVPSTDVGELSELEYTQAEFDENDQRLNISWQEKAAATARLDRLRSLQSKQQNTPPPTIADLAQERRGSRENNAVSRTRKEIIVNRHLGDKEVAGARTLDEAFDLLKRREDSAKRAEEAKRIGQTFSSADHSLYNLDTVEWIKDVPSDSFDIVLTDPPFGMGAHEFGDTGKEHTHAHEYDDSPEVLRSLLTFGIAEQLYRVAKPQAHLYWFCDLDWFGELRDKFLDAGWKVHRTPLIWHKANAWRAPWPDQGPRRCYELILYAVKGQRKTLSLGSDVISVPLETQRDGAKKPVELYLELLKRSANAGDSVLDPFCGTGPIFPAAHTLKCKATGVELRAEEYTKAANRLKELK